MTTTIEIAEQMEMDAKALVEILHADSMAKRFNQAAQRLRELDKPKWHKGAPPSIGWWPASFGRQKQSIRWWDGFFWSDFALPSYTAKMAAKCATLRNCGDGIEWTERWWL